MTDYSEITPPEDKPPEEYSYNHRRAEILQMIEKKGHPWGFNYAQLGRRYGVSREQIRKDFKRLKDWYRDRVGNDAKVSSELAYKRIVQEQTATSRKPAAPLTVGTAGCRTRASKKRNPSKSNTRGASSTSPIR